MEFTRRGVWGCAYYELVLKKKIVTDLQCSLDYTEKYYLDYTENKAHSLGVRKTICVLRGRLSKLV